MRHRAVRNPTARVRVARFATFIIFGLNGFILGMWAVHIPVVERRTGIGHDRLGWLLLLLALGAMGGMRFCGRLADRFGARTVLTLAGLLLSVSLAGPALATSTATLAVALIVFGFANGALDISMNTHAVAVERRYPRAIMSAFHAVFSVGGVVASLAAAHALGRGWGIHTTLLGIAGGAVLVTAVASRGLLRGPRHQPATSHGEPASRSRWGQIHSLGLLAFLLLLSEGVAYDWAAVHLRDVLDVPPATAALGYGAFATAMTLGRLGADRVAARLGPVFVLRYGAVLATAGLATAALTSWLPLALLGWAMFGAGLSGCVPQVFTVAGNIDPAAAGKNLSRVAGTGYLGLLVGPASIGLLTHAVPLNLAFLLPVACCAIAASYAGRACQSVPRHRAAPTRHQYRNAPRVLA